MNLSPQAPFFGTKRYHDRVDAQTRQAFLVLSKQQHKSNMDDLEELWDLNVTRQHPTTALRVSASLAGKTYPKR